jgi:serine/threonine protein kinase
MKNCPGCGAFYEGNDKEFCDLDGLALQQVREPEKAGDPFLGTVVDGRYLVQSILGKGGMGAVYKARQTSVERDIALKVILGETSEDLRSRFMLEAKMTSSLQSVHTVTIFDFGVFKEDASRASS